MIGYTKGHAEYVGSKIAGAMPEKPNQQEQTFYTPMEQAERAGARARCKEFEERSKIPSHQRRPLFIEKIHRDVESDQKRPTIDQTTHTTPLRK